MTLFRRLRCWFRNQREETDWRIDRARQLNEQQMLLTENANNWLARRYTGNWEGNRDDS